MTRHTTATLPLAAMPQHWAPVSRGLNVERGATPSCRNTRSAKVSFQNHGRPFAQAGILRLRTRIARIGAARQKKGREPATR